MTLEIKIYVDVLWLVNFILNYLLLWMTGLLLRQPRFTLRLACAASFGALYAVCIFFLPVSVLYTIPGKAAVGMLMTAIAFRPHRFKVFIKYICVFYAAVFIFGGAAFSLFYFSGSAAVLGTVIRNGTLYINLPVYLLLLLAAGCWLVLKTAFFIVGRVAALGHAVCKVHIVYHENTVTLRGYYDSGNLLCEETTHRGVMVTSWDCVKPLFHNLPLPPADGDGFKTLSYQTLQGTATLSAFLPDALYVGCGRSLRQIYPVYIALTEHNLNYYNTWDAILPRDFEGVEEHETNMDRKAAGAFQAAQRTDYKMAER